MRRRKQVIWTEMYDVFGRFRGLAWKQNSPYTSYLLYVDPWGSC